MIHSKFDNTSRPVDLSARAMLVQLSVSQWSGRKLDKKVTADVNASHGAASDAGRYNKALVAKDALADIAATVGKARADHVYLSLPWLQDGTRIIPAAAFAEYSARMQKHREAFEKAVDAFCANYAEYVDEARTRLNGMFDDSDYPDEWQIRRKFGWNVQVFPMPDAKDFRVDLSADLVDNMRAEMETAMQGAIEHAMADVWTRLHDVVRAMADKLKAYKPKTDTDRAQGIFRDSLVENVRDLAAILPSLNLTGDARLAAIADEVADKLTAYDAADLRDNDLARKETAEIAERIADDMAAFMGA